MAGAKSAVDVTYDGSNITYKSPGSSQEAHIPKENVIGLLPPNASSEHHILLYVKIREEESSSGEAPKTPIESRTFFHSLQVSNAPAQLLKDFPASNDHPWLPSQGNQTGSEESTFTVVVSRGSGRQLATYSFGKLIDGLLSLLVSYTDNKLNPHVIFTTSASTITQWTRSVLIPRAKSGIFQTVLLLSGDGGVRDIIDAALNTDAALSPTYKKPCITLMPFGTGNALANSSIATPDNTLGLSAFLRGTPKNLPLMQISLPGTSYALDSRGKPVERTDENSADKNKKMVLYGAVVFSWCFHASLVADSDGDAYRKFGAQRFQMAAKENLFPSDGSGPHVYRGAVQILPSQHENTSNATPANKQEWQVLDIGGFSYFTLALVSNFEKTFCISPRSRALDGKLWIVYMAETEDGGEGVMRAMTLAYDGGKHVEDAAVGYRAVDGVRLEIEEAENRWRRVCVDGQIFVVGRGADGKEGYVEVTREDREILDLMVI